MKLSADIYVQFELVADVCPTCGEWKENVVEVRRMRNHRLVRRICQDCMEAGR